MCRLVAFPPNFPKKKALSILDPFSLGNDDGTGSVYIKDNEFVVNKWPLSFEEVVEKKLPLLDHMPYNGWTIAHVRAISHGGKSMRNTHPFILDNWAMAHNGIFSEYAPVKAVLQKALQVDFEGRTDSEVALQLWEHVGKEHFIKSMSSGVFMFLNKTGQLDVVCCNGGDLMFQKTKWGVVLASELDRKEYKRTHTVLEGNFKLSKKGLFIHANWEKDKGANWGYASSAQWARSYSSWDDDEDIDLLKVKSKSKVRRTFRWGKSHLAYD
jgi:predicted glutamine amidotransferase